MQIQISWLLQKPTDLDLHCLQRQGISGFSRTRVKCSNSKCLRNYSREEYFNEPGHSISCKNARAPCEDSDPQSNQGVSQVYLSIIVHLTLGRMSSHKLNKRPMGQDSLTWECWPRWFSWMRVQLVIWRLRVRPPPGRQHFFMEIWSWNIFYGHYLPSADSRRTVVSFWRKNVHITG